MRCAPTSRRAWTASRSRATAALGAVGYGGYPDEAPTTALRAHDSRTSMMPPVRDDIGAYFEEGRGRRRQRRRANSPRSCSSSRRSSSSSARSSSARPSSEAALLTASRCRSSRARRTRRRRRPPATVASRSPRARQSTARTRRRAGSATPTPPRASEIDRDDTVTLNMSKGAPPVEVPDVEGDAYAERQEGAGGRRLQGRPEGRGRPTRTPAPSSNRIPRAAPRPRGTRPITLTVAQKQTLTVPAVDRQELRRGEGPTGGSRLQRREGGAGRRDQPGRHRAEAGPCCQQQARQGRDRSR